MRTWHAVAAAALLALVLPSAGQREQPYFSLSSSRTYGPGESPSIQLSGYGVDVLQFRVYRVRDPLVFFERLEEQHRFGGRAPRPPHKLTLLERFHRWKARRRDWVRDLFRSQFTQEQRWAIRDWWLKRGQEPVHRAAPARAEFANVPLLNAQQVVAVWQQRVSRAERWAYQTVPVQVKDKGLYLVEATNGTLQAYTIVSVTDLAVIAKGSPGRVLARVVNRATGAPAAGCPVVLRSRKQEPLRLRADEQGLIEARLSEERPEDVLLLARQGDDFAAVSLYGWSLGTDPERNLTGYIYTDRPVYRPGHTVYFRGILRVQSEAGYQLFQRKEVEVEVQDPEGKSVFKKTLPLGAVGAFHGDWKLAGDAALGYYSIELRTGSAFVSGGFHVEEYKKPEYEVRVTPAVRRVVQGEPVQVLIEARYYYGEPVAQAKVAYVVHRSRYWAPFYGEPEELEEEEGSEGDYYGGGEQVLAGAGQLDPQGRLTVSIPTEISPHDLRYRIGARVTDAAGREISGAAVVVATIANYLVHVEADQYLYTPGQTARLAVETRDYDNNPVGGIGFRVEVSERRWKQPPGPVVVAVEGRTEANGKATVEVPLARAGSFVAHAASRAPEGREVADDAYLWVSGAGAGWLAERRERIELVPGKKSYAPGEVAKILIITGVPAAHLWVTVEGRRVETLKLVSGDSPTVTVEVPVRPEHAPNFFVSAAFLYRNQLYQGTKTIRVPPVEHRLSVEVSASKDQFRPGETGLYTIQARDSVGRPVSAEFSLGVVDESLYAVRPETTPDILKFFYGSAPNRVSTDTSLSFYFYGEAGKRRMPLAWVRPAGAHAQLKPEKFVQPEVRRAFPDTIYWVADLRTDSNGRAQAQVSFPDALTTWRATARGVTADTRVGSALERVIVRKNLILRLAAPRFFTQGDEVVVSAIVHNYLASQKRVRLSLAAQGLELLEGATTDVTVATRGQAQVDFRLRARLPGKAVLLGQALTDEESDALELTLPILPYGVKLLSARAGSMAEPQGQAEVELGFPAEATPEARSLTLEVTPSLAGAIFGALDYLTSFPYGCTEQTMSSFLPNVVVAQAAKTLGLKSSVDQAALGKKIREGLDRLYDFQHEDGGWGWWQTDESQVFMTAYVVAGLAQAQAAGYGIRPNVLDRGTSWLRQQWPKLERATADLRAYVAYSLAEAGQREPSWLEALWSQRQELSPYGLALLGLGMQRAGDSRAAEAATLLEAAARSDEREAFWQVSRDPLMDLEWDVTAEATAYALKFLARQRPESPLLPKAAVYLVNHRDQGAWWASTKQTAMVVYGLTDYLRQSGELRPDFGVTVWVNDRPVLERRFGEADSLAGAPVEVRIPASQLASGQARIRLRKSGAGRLYWSARAEYYSTASRLVATGSVSLNLLRDYFRLAPAQEGGRIVYRLEPLEGAVRKGDVIAVRLTLTGGQWRYLMLEDPIPAGAEFIERDELYELQDKPPWWQSWYTRREFHDDRAAVFQTFFSRGQAQYFYLLKVVNAGRFQISPARVQPMYQPNYLATTESRVLEVR